MFSKRPKGCVESTSWSHQKNGTNYLNKGQNLARQLYTSIVYNAHEVCDDSKCKKIFPIFMHGRACKVETLFGNSCWLKAKAMAKLGMVEIYNKNDSFISTIESTRAIMAFCKCLSMQPKVKFKCNATPISCKGS